MEKMTVSEMMRISVAMPILLVLSIVVMGQALERLYAFWVTLKLPAALWRKVRGHLKDGDRQSAYVLCERHEGPVPAALARIVALPVPSAENIVEAFQFYRQKLHLDMSRRLGIFGTASFIAPLIGLMGTVLGIMRAFHDLAKAGAGGPAVVAAGISEALVATAAGIAVAVVSAILHNYFTLTVRRRMAEIDLWVFELADLLAPALAQMQAPAQPPPPTAPLGPPPYENPPLP